MSLEGDYRRVVEDCSAVIQLDPSCVTAFIDRGVAKCKLGEYGVICIGSGPQEHIQKNI